MRKRTRTFHDPPPEQLAAQQALGERLTELGAGPLRANRTARVEDNLVPSLSGAQCAAALEQLAAGDGSELEHCSGLPPAAHSAHSSAALVVNSFAWWIGRERDLSIADRTDFTVLRFERKLPIFRGGRAPNLDLVAENNEVLVGVESKLTEYLAPSHWVGFSEAYARAEAFGEFAHQAWKREFEAVSKEGRARYRRLDAAQLLKHYLGLRKHAAGRRVVLAYLYWEPLNPDAVAYGQHRRELAAFSEHVADGDVEFHALSYSELWSRWGECEADPDEHVARLRHRYEVAVEHPARSE